MAAEAKKSVKRRKKNDSAQPPFSLVADPASAKFAEAFASVAKLLDGRKNVVVLAGAGISVSCGIPDFRSKESGIYAKLDVDELGLSCPEDLFDWEFFLEDPHPFYKFAKALYFPLGDDRRVEPSDSHRFLALLEQKGMLLRVYSQNIDGLEQIAGISPKKMVYAHGSLQWAICTRCKHRVDASDIESHVLNGTVPRCRQVKETPGSVEPRVETTKRSKRRRQSEDELDKSLCNGVLKPGVTFFGEPLHSNVKRCLEVDRSRADAIIVIGTSLSVAPMSHVIEFLPTNLPRILINRTIVHPPILPNMEENCDGDKDVDFRHSHAFDAYLLGFCDDVTRALVKEMTGSGGSKSTKEEGKLLACLQENDDVYHKDDWEDIELPRDRVFLFPGAVSGNGLSEYSYREIAHCDGCSNQIIGEIRKCKQCFDYDLCEACYPELSLSHYSGQHTFATETSNPSTM